MATIRHKKSLGQHFLEDQAILEGIVDCAELEKDDIRDFLDNLSV